MNIMCFLPTKSDLEIYRIAKKDALYSSSHCDPDTVTASVTHVVGSSKLGRLELHSLYGIT